MYVCLSVLISDGCLHIIMVIFYDRTALHIAACGQNQRIVDLLLTRDGTTALVMQDNEGNTPLHKVYRYGHHYGSPLNKVYNTLYMYMSLIAITISTCTLYSIIILYI